MAATMNPTDAITPVAAEVSGVGAGVVSFFTGASPGDNLGEAAGVTAASKTTIETEQTLRNFITNIPKSRSKSTE